MATEQQAAELLQPISAEGGGRIMVSRGTKLLLYVLLVALGLFYLLPFAWGV